MRNLLISCVDWHTREKQVGHEHALDLDSGVPRKSSMLVLPVRSMPRICLHFVQSACPPAVEKLGGPRGQLIVKAQVVYPERNLVHGFMSVQDSWDCCIHIVHVVHVSQGIVEWLPLIWTRPWPTIL